MPINEIVLVQSLISCKERIIKGTVKWFSSDKGYGFIVPEDGSKDLFVHHSEIKSDGEFSSLSDGQSVEFEVGEGPKGPCAVNVKGV